MKGRQGHRKLGVCSTFKPQKGGCLERTTVLANHPGILTGGPGILAMIQGSRSCGNFVMTFFPDKFEQKDKEVVTMTKNREEWSQNQFPCHS